MSTRLPGFRGEYLWEYEIAERQLLALAEAFPAERYGWRPAETARSVSEVLVHVGAGGHMLLALLGVKAEPDLYGKLEGEGVARAMAMLVRNESLEKSMTDKADVLASQPTSHSASGERYYTTKTWQRPSSTGFSNEGASFTSMDLRGERVISTWKRPCQQVQNGSEFPELLAQNFGNPHAGSVTAMLSKRKR